MKRLNIVLVYDEKCEKILMCLRQKDPYQGLFNLVGGKVEEGEDSLEAAYRELYEETHIEKKDIDLIHLMDLTYPLENFMLEVYAGKLFHDKEVYGNENPLYWIDKNENFFDMGHFAGKGNIAHIVSVVENDHPEILEDVMLIKPSVAYTEEIMSYRQEFLENGDSMDGTGGLRNIKDPIEWIKSCRDFEDLSKVPAHLVSSEQFILVRKEDQRIVGMIQLRHRLNDYLLNYGGHIGYSVRKSERRKGYANLMLSKMIQIAKHKKMDKLLITCLDHNEASRKTILKNGGIYEDKRYEENLNEYLERYWISLQ